MEDESFLNIYHEHPLSLISNSAQNHDHMYYPRCFGCWRNFLPEDAIYGCNRHLCRFELLLHKECMEMPREIMHPVHPSHSLTLYLSFMHIKCAICKRNSVWGLSYKCSQGSCDGFEIHLGCAVGLNDKDPAQPVLNHPSHPQHELRFSKKTRWCPFPCDACGATEKGDSYTCNICDYWIHESCALLPASKEFPHHHPAHPLSLAFGVPTVYIEYEFECAVCNKTLLLRRWVYHCNLCSYVVHINCANSMFDDENANAIDDEKEVSTIFPITVEDMYEEMIVPFVKRESGQILVPSDHNNHNIGGKYKFSNHPHLLTFVTFLSSSSSSSSHHHYKKEDEEEEEEEEEEEDDDEDFDSIPSSELICDGCTLAIHEKKQTDDGDGYESGYMSCDECKYFLHLSCFNLPLEILNHPTHPLNDHKLMLRNVDCRFQIDIKCASQPNTIKHAAHPRHNHLKLQLVTTVNIWPTLCAGCFEPGWDAVKYKCSSCRFSLCGRCVMLPARNKHRSEKHLLSLTYDAYVNRPGEFYCSSCEYQMINPRIWMYHCRDCDQSFHPKCFPATSGQYRNIKFGTQQYVISSIHDPRHRLSFQIITKKKRCDLCHGVCYANFDRYNRRIIHFLHGLFDGVGFQCESCFFVACKPCGVKHIEDARAI
ncbi:uncharacterized protein LOC125223643 isoform X2 [Salvia hispanica]|uniref:uncharacterized protein LOC125223643 isoform X2 n=1 Tax=Salvia hispanica TaxID=49212 RepID=UPI00200947CC|nr:uncharacterized protein LOC125223643 isoform X2 [Salvia hispanica]